MADQPKNTDEKTHGSTATAARPESTHKLEKLPPYNVVLLDDASHTYEYVIEMLAGLFGYNEVKGFQLAKRVDSEGRAIVATMHREKAELKVAQIEAFGLDPRIPTCKSGMKAFIEPAEG
ncbi:MAG: ATP-dependent Clp protease adaptor ClpS [Planctomycetota bacterium]